MQAVQRQFPARRTGTETAAFHRDIVGHGRRLHLARDHGDVGPLPDPTALDDLLDGAHLVVVATGALEELEAEIATRVAMAVEAVTDATGLLAPAAVDELVALAAYITDRQH